MRTYWFTILICGLLLTGCGDKETITSTEPAPAPAVKPAVTEQVKKTADDVAKQATEMVETGTQLIKDTAAEATQAVKEVVATAKKDVTAIAEVAKKKTTEIVDNSKQKAVEVKEKLTQDGAQLLSNLQTTPADSKTQDNSLLSNVTAAASSATSSNKIVTEAQPAEAPSIETKSSVLLPSVAAVASSVTASSEVTAEAQPPEILVIKNKNGNVTLQHAEHGKLYGCAACHGDTVPGPFELEKDTAHAMCKGCHKEQDGPTKCSDCHKK